MGRPDIGILEWFHLHDRDHVQRALDDLKSLDVDHLRTGVSWADWHADGGEEWFDYYIPRLGEEVELLPCFTYTPPSIGEMPRTSAPPNDLGRYSDFVTLMIDKYGEYFDHVELWNEPNNRAEWDWTLDPGWEKFARMVRKAAKWSQEKGKKVVLGGMSPIDPNWLDAMFQHGLHEHLDVVGVHGFPGTWEVAWDGWDVQIDRVQQVIDDHGSDADVWITEVGYSTWDHDGRAQLDHFLDVLDQDVPRVYWYALEDLDPKRSSHVGYHTDEREYHFGLKDAQSRPKLLHRLWSQGGVDHVQEQSWLTLPPELHGDPVLVTGGAGFVGVKLSERLLERGERVIILDNLERPTALRNAQWIKSRFGDDVQLDVADIRNADTVPRCVSEASAVFHCAGQVAVTTSIDDPTHDFEVNASGTLNLLEAMRRRDDPPPLVYTSTNKVYGRMPDVEVERQGDRYVPVDEELAQHGVSEDRPLSFHTPYGCSKGAADQYVLDYARTYDLPASVFRMSCIYGPRQFGTEDQGWAAHFLIQALRDEPITIYGDGYQVRDTLFVDELVDAFLLAREHMDDLRGRPFNIGGGPERSTSLREFLDLVEDIHGSLPEVRTDDWRQGDQPWYVSDTRRFRDATGWDPRVGLEEGVEHLHGWLREALVGEDMNRTYQEATLTAPTTGRTVTRT